MAYPRLTFFCELETNDLQNTLTPAVISQLSALKAGLSLGLLDLSPERAQVVKALNAASIPVTAWLLLPKEQGYWFNAGNYHQAFERYHEFLAWTKLFGLEWTAIGLDIEPDIRELQQWVENKWRIIPTALRRALNRRKITKARLAYTQLVSQVKADGFQVESYQFPIIVDERNAGSTLVQRLSGLVDVKVDREVLMLYTSFLGAQGVGILASYVPEAQAVALGTTGGGVEAGIGDPYPMTWQQLERDLRLAWNWCNTLYIFSLEGCIRQGFLPKLKNFAWDQPILLPEASTEQVNGWRASLASALWVSARARWILVGALAALVGLLEVKRRFIKRK